MTLVPTAIWVRGAGVGVGVGVGVGSRPIRGRKAFVREVVWLTGVAGTVVRVGAGVRVAVRVGVRRAVCIAGAASLSTTGMAVAASRRKARPARSQGRNIGSDYGQDGLRWGIP